LKTALATSHHQHFSKLAISQTTLFNQVISTYFQQQVRLL